MGWQLNAHRVARTRISVGRLRDRLLRRQNNANSLFFWFVWIGHQTERIDRIASLKMSNLLLAKFIRIPKCPGPAVNQPEELRPADRIRGFPDRKSTRLNSSHTVISYAVFC